MLYFVTPIRLIFLTDETRHTVRTARDLKDGVGLVNNIQAAVGEGPRERLIQVLARDIKDLVERLKETHPTIELADFQFEYSYRQTDSKGRCWGDGGLGGGIAKLVDALGWDGDPSPTDEAMLAHINTLRQIYSGARWEVRRRAADAVWKEGGTNPLFLNLLENEIRIILPESKPTT